MRTAHHPGHRFVEILEQRIAPASLTFIDVDGDTVSVVTSKGSDAELLLVASLVPKGDGHVLQYLDLSENLIFQGTSVKITAMAADSSPSTVDVGYIRASGLDLKSVEVAGDLGEIDAGDANRRTPAIKTLHVGSIGVGDASASVPDYEPVSDFRGAVGRITIEGDLQGRISAMGNNGRIGTLQIDGSIAGGEVRSSGSVHASQDIREVLVGGDIVGGAGPGSGTIFAGLGIKSVVVEGSIIGGFGVGVNSGAISTDGSIKSVTIGGDIIGGAGEFTERSGLIRAGKTINKIEVSGAVIGGDGVRSGAIMADQLLQTAEIHGGITGGAGAESGTVGSLGVVGKVVVHADETSGLAILGGAGLKSGAILSGANLTQIEINGNVQGGSGETSGVVASGGTLKKVLVNGDVIGGAGKQSGAIGSDGVFGDAVVNGDVIGGRGEASGQVVSKADIKSIEINGSVIGGEGFESGALGSLGVLRSVKITGDLNGGAGERSGSVLSGNQLPSVEIGGNVIGNSGLASGTVSSEGTIGRIFVGGDIEGGGGNLSGNIRTESQSGDIAQIIIKGSIYGGDGDHSGGVRSGGRLHTLTLGSDVPPDNSEGETPSSRSETVFGSVEGGDGFNSGAITSGGDMGQIEIAAHLDGGFGDHSGAIQSAGGIANLSIGLNVFGGSGNYFDSSEGGSTALGQIFASGSIGTVQIGGYVNGGSGGYSATVVGASIKSVTAGNIYGGPGFYSGSIIAREGDIQSVEVEQTIANFTFDGGESGLNAASIAAARNIGTVTAAFIQGSGAPVRITAGGTIGASSGQAMAIGSVNVSIEISGADILAGYDIDGRPVNPDVQIGAVRAGNGSSDGETGNFFGTNVVAGVEIGEDGIFGTNDDFLIEAEGASSKTISRIKLIEIAGRHYSQDRGFVAEEIEAIKLGGQLESQLTKGPRNDSFEFDVHSGAGTNVSELPSD